MKNKKIILQDEQHNEFDITELTSKEQKMLSDIWDNRAQYEAVDFSKLPLLAEYVRMFCAMQDAGDSIRNTNDVEILEASVTRYAKLQKIVFEYRKILKLDQMKEKSSNRWADILMKRG